MTSSAPRRLTTCIATAVAMVVLVGCGSDNDAVEVTTAPTVPIEVVGTFSAKFDGGSAARTYETTVAISCSGKTLCTVTFDDAAGQAVSYESVREGASVLIEQFVSTGSTDCVTRSTTEGSMTVGGDILNGTLLVKMTDDGTAASCSNATTSSEYEVTGTRQPS